MTNPDDDISRRGRIHADAPRDEVCGDPEKFLIQDDMLAMYEIKTPEGKKCPEFAIYRACYIGKKDRQRGISSLEILGIW